MGNRSQALLKRPWCSSLATELQVRGIQMHSGAPVRYSQPVVLVWRPAIPSGAVCNAAVWQGVQRDEFLLQNLAVNPSQLPEGVQRGTVSRNAVLVEATRSNDIRILQFKLCKLEKNLTWMLLARGVRGKDICQCVSVCVLATEVHNGGAKLREELVAFVRSNADALSFHVVIVCFPGMLI
eukprot:gene1866-33283_t